MSRGIKNSQLVRFALVGGVNTALDFGIFLTLATTGLDVKIANVISTSLAFVFSFFANKKYTFKTTDSNVRREILLFIIVTLFGLWILQTIVIQGVLALLTSITLDDSLKRLIAKLIATIVSLTWNYLLYSRVVFKKAP